MNANARKIAPAMAQAMRARRLIRVRVRRRVSSSGGIKKIFPSVEFRGKGATAGQDGTTPMTRISLRAALVMALLAPAAAFAQHFEAVDNIPWPRLGRYPAYPPEAPKATEFWVNGGALHDNNVFRLSKDANRQALLGTTDASDDIYRLEVGARHEQLIAGRQRIRLEARGDQYVFRNFDQLNNFAYGLRGEWLWEVTNDFNGSLGYERRTRLTDLAQLQAPIKDMIAEDHAFLNGAWRIGPSMRLRGGVDATRAEHQDNARAAANTRALTGTAGLDYVTALGNSAGIEFRATHGNYPTNELVSGTLVNNEFNEREIAGVVALVAGPTLTGNARLGHTERKHKDFPERDFSGTTWR